jgi:hypothetical protein
VTEAATAETEWQPNEQHVQELVYLACARAGGNYDKGQCYHEGATLLLEALAFLSGEFISDTIGSDDDEGQGHQYEAVDELVARFRESLEERLSLPGRDLDEETHPSVD